MTIRSVLLALSLFVVGCAPVPVPTTPPTPVPPAPPMFCVAVNLHAGTVDGPPIVGAHVLVLGAKGDTNQDGYLYLYPLSPGATTIHVEANGFEAKDVPYVVASLQCDVAIVLTPHLPPPPTRDQALNVCLTFQGLVVETQQFGELPSFEAAMAWLQPADRQTWYAAKHGAKNPFCPAGDTHSIIAVPDGFALYDEPNQPYSADRFGPLDWTANFTRVDGRLADLVVEQRRAGFIPLVFLDERFTQSNAMLPLVIDALQHSAYGDLTPHIVLLPGWDGVFYGWEPSHVVIPAWSTRARQLCPACILGIEHGTGHIPLGEGDSDWVHGGLMKDFDLLLSEFDDARFDDSVWQIAARTIGPAYRRPADQTPDDDPGSPFDITSGRFYLRQPTDRGPRRACAFEFFEFGWVHDWYRADHAALLKDVQDARQYFTHVGYSCGG